MTPKQAAEILGLDYTTVLHHLKKSGQLTGHRDDAGRWQVDPESVAEFQKPLDRGAGRKPSPETLHDSGQRLFLGNEVSPEEMKRIRRLPARLRAAVLLRLADLAEREPETFKRALESLGVEWEPLRRL